uniref:Probable folate-biopterin transporter 6 n=1 Tax=Tanacetum cinerariifolium TaxID=118510 RepID=A0A6L2P173_TANCI|nr:probable folate-biopterin transporter 6 [Tanacetum cinerariifolium]
MISSTLSCEDEVVELDWVSFIILLLQRIMLESLFETGGCDVEQLLELVLDEDVLQLWFFFLGVENIALGLLAIPASSQIFLGFVIYEKKTTDHDSSIKKKQAIDNLGGALRGMYDTIQIPQVWKPSLYMYLSIALSFSTHEGHFYWYTDSKAGPAFSQELVGMVHAIGACASIVGVLIYHKLLKDYPFRKLLFFAQLVYALSGFLDLIFILRWNLALGIPDYLFVVLEECVTRIVSRVRWMPMIVLSTSLCPIGLEGTFFALLMSIDSLGSLSSKWGGAIVLQVFHVTRTDFTNLWLVTFIKNIMRLVTLCFIFLVPNTGRLDTPNPSDILQSESKNADLETNSDNLQLLGYFLPVLQTALYIHLVSSKKGGHT